MAQRSPETLGDFISRIRREKNLSLADVSRQSTRYGKRIAASYINRIENDPTRKVTADRLAALAHGLGVPVQELLARAVGVSGVEPSSDEFYLVTRFRELSPERKVDVLAIVNLWHSQG